MKHEFSPQPRGFDRVFRAHPLAVMAFEAYAGLRRVWVQREDIDGTRLHTLPALDALRVIETYPRREFSAVVFRKICL